MNIAKKVLVVDDDPDILEQVGLMLKTAGYEVVSAESAERAEEKLMSTHPDIAVVDLMMENPDSGLVLCHQIKQIYPDVPIILLTSVRASTRMDFDFDSPETKLWIKADTILDKPVRSEELLNCIKKLLRR